MSSAPDQQPSGESAALAEAYRGRRILVTGHTGFKGGWLSFWLSRLGARITGIALPAPPGPNFYYATRLGELVDDRTVDIRSPVDLSERCADIDAELVFHMAAQAFVRESYATPADTYLTNVVGTANVLDCARRMPSLHGVVVVTSDKCYENREWPWGYRESDVLGGADPYSSSKACTELVVDAYRKSFFSGPDSPLLATVRAGNVIGGGDWGKDRLIPDIARATAVGSPTLIRNPHSVRPWQHVLEPLCGYLKIGARLLARDHTFAGPWNFGPRDTVNVATLAQHVKRAWGGNGPEFEFGDSKDAPHEAQVLRLDSTKAHVQLGWRPQLDVRQAIDMTVEWYRAHAKGTADLRVLTERQIATYEKLSEMASESAGEKDQYRQCV